MKTTVKLVVVVVLILGLNIGAAVVRADDAVNMAGTWDLVVTSPTGEKTNGKYILEQKENQLTGTYEDSRGSWPIIKGSVNGNDFEIIGNVGIDTITKGKVEGNKLTAEADCGPYGKWPITGEKK
jgi:hypothetical protein